MVEHPAVNGRVVGSSPTPGEILKKPYSVTVFEIASLTVLELRREMT